MTSYAPKKLRAFVDKKNDGSAVYHITLNREVRLSEDIKVWIGSVANGGRSKCLVSVLQKDKTVIEVSISRGPSGDAAVVLEKICLIVSEIAKRLQVTPEYVTVVYLTGRIADMTLSDMEDLVKRASDSTSQHRRARRQVFVAS